LNSLIKSDYTISEAVGITQQAVSKITTELNQLNLVVKSDYYDKHKKPEGIAENHQPDMPRAQKS
jgi:hypothetical protein